MIHLRWGLSIAGSLVGFVIGAVCGMVVVVNRAMRTYRTELARAGIVVICTQGLGYLAGRIGYRTN